MQTITIAVQIGNSDDKLTQKEWSEFYHDTYSVIETMGRRIWFSGTSGPAEAWQNACFVFSVDSHDLTQLRGELRLLASEYSQDSIALMILGEAEFLS